MRKYLNYFVVYTYFFYLYFFFKVCDSRMQVLDMVVRWPGSCHDSHIWRFSTLRHCFSTRTIPRNNFLIGDSGYPLEPWLLTPYLNPITPPEEIFNVKLRRTRNVVERCFGVLKSRFRFLDKTGGSLCYEPKKACKFIIAATVLHNICLQYSVPQPTEPINNHNDDEDDNDDDDDDSVSGVNILTEAEIIRDTIAMQFQRSR